MHRRRPNGSARPADTDYEPVPLTAGRKGARSTGSGGKLHVMILVWFAVLATIALWRHHSLPTPGKCGDQREFSECNARETIRGLAHTIGMRLVGTKQEALARDMILDKLHGYKSDAAAQGTDVPVFDIDVQVADGSHRFDLMGQALIKTYTNITNIVARLSCGPECDGNAILLNSHFDSTIVSPGASDDGAGVAVMLELIRILSQRKEKMKNAVIFLWNGAEETLQDASHAFITQHKYRDTIRGVINLEAMGQGGKEILFQANSKEMISAYSRVPNPHGSVLSNDIFRTGLVMSDTDFRQFVDHGGLVGLDMAFYTNSYLYHTMLDVEDTIEKGSLQNFGENAMAMLDYLLYESDLAVIDRNDDLVFFDLLGVWFFHYTWAQAHIGHWIVIALSVAAVLIPRRARNGQRLSNTVKAAGTVLASNLGSILVSAMLGVALMIPLKASLVWFSREWYPVVLFGPMAVLGSLLPQLWLRARHTRRSLVAQGKKGIPSPTDSGDADLERTVYDALILAFAGLITLADHFELGISYVFTMYTVGLLVGRALDLVLSKNQEDHIHPAAYIAAALPFAISTELTTGTLNLFVPISGRTGADTPSDVIVAVLTGALLFLHFYLLLPLTHRLSPAAANRSAKMVALVGLLVVAIFVLAVKPFDTMHPKRVFVEYKENLTDNTREVMIAHADSGSVAAILSAVEKQTGTKPILRTASVTGRDWSTIAPFSNFMESYAFDISHTPPLTRTTHTDDTTRGPQLDIVKDTYDKETDIRRLSIRCYYPRYIWTVLTFSADVVSWSLDDTTMLNNGGNIPITLRHAGGYPTNDWTLDVTVRGSKPITMEISGLEQDTFHELVNDDEESESWKERKHQRQGEVGTAVGPVRIGKAWKWSDRFEPASVLAALEKVMPDWTTGLYIAVVVRRFEV
ncbi:hypothetical protein DFJ77DRAFT_447028 [Powellomyces hirtus]|nr:hypothetical protein DFJ77DRAFT_447028 [Powellomyces hirtus]